MRAWSVEPAGVGRCMLAWVDIPGKPVQVPGALFLYNVVSSHHHGTSGELHATTNCTIFVCRLSNTINDVFIERRVLIWLLSVRDHIHQPHKCKCLRKASTNSV